MAASCQGMEGGLIISAYEYHGRLPPMAFIPRRPSWTACNFASKTSVFFPILHCPAMRSVPCRYATQPELQCWEPSFDPSVYNRTASLGSSRYFTCSWRFSWSVGVSESLLTAGVWTRKRGEGVGPRTLNPSSASSTLGNYATNNSGLLSVG